MLKRLYEHLGTDVLNVAYRNLFSAVLYFAGRLWCYLITIYNAWPYKLVRLAALLQEGSSCSRDAAFSLAEELFVAKDCCSDRCISMRVRDRVKDEAPILGFNAARVC